jgi:hypothetical protein
MVNTLSRTHLHTPAVPGSHILHLVCMDHSKCRLICLAAYAPETHALTRVHIEPMCLAHEVDICDTCMEGVRGAGCPVPGCGMNGHAAIQRRRGGGREAREKGEMLGFTESHFGKVGEEGRGYIAAKGTETGNDVLAASGRRSVLAGSLWKRIHSCEVESRMYTVTLTYDETHAHCSTVEHDSSVLAISHFAWLPSASRLQDFLQLDGRTTRRLWGQTPATLR